MSKPVQLRVPNTGVCGRSPQLLLGNFVIFEKILPFLHHSQVFRKIERTEFSKIESYLKKLKCPSPFSPPPLLTDEVFFFRLYLLHENYDDVVWVQPAPWHVVPSCR